jgi:hypothetical protein
MPAVIESHEELYATSSGEHSGQDLQSHLALEFKALGVIVCDRIP